MTGRAFCFLLFASASLALGLAFGNAVYWLIAFVLLAVFCFSLVSILLLRSTLRVETELKERQVIRGDRLHITVSVSQKCPFPAGACVLTVLKGGQEEDTPFVLHPLREDLMDCTLVSSHVGTFFYGASRLSVTDLFSLFRVCVRPPEVPRAAVLPRSFEIEKIGFLLSGEGRTALARTQEDPTSPEDVRAYAPGDPLKRVHWKLSARKQEVLVRRFETPAPPDTLILVDPVISGAREAGEEDFLTLRDLICETCCSAAERQLRDQSPVRVPFYGEHPGEFTADDPSHLLLLQQMLAMQSFREEVSFETILHMELRRMQRTGAVIILTTRLSASLVEDMGAIRKMGPGMRVYLASLKLDEEKWQPCVTRLQHYMAEVCYVTPA